MAAWRRVAMGWMAAGWVALATPGTATSAVKDLTGVINLNTADAGLLALLPGVGPAKAESILRYRVRHPFRTVDELVRIKGIGRRMVRALRSHLAVSGPSTARPGLAPIPDRPVLAAAPTPPAPPPRPGGKPGSSPRPAVSAGSPPVKPRTSPPSVHSRADACLGAR